MMRLATPAAGQGPQHYWSQMLRMSRTGGFTITDIFKASTLRARRTVKSYVEYCAKAGFIHQVGERPTEKNRVAIVYKVRDRRLPAPVQRRDEFTGDRGRRAQQMWTAMRALRQFTALELAIAASTDSVPVLEGTARTYLRSLGRAGYVVPFARTGRNGARQHWKLMPARNTGPLAPAILNQGTVVFDRNLKQVVNVTGTETTGAAA